MLPPALIGFNLEEAVSLLLRDLPDDWIRAHEGDKTWSSFDVVAHLIHADRTNWIPRARIILDHGEVRPFDEFDRFAHFAESHGRTMVTLLTSSRRFVKTRSAI